MRKERLELEAEAEKALRVESVVDEHKTSTEGNEYTTTDEV